MQILSSSTRFPWKLLRWFKFKQTWDAYELITGLNKDTDEMRLANWIVTIGPDALDIHNALPYKEGEEKVFQKVLDYWTEYCVGKTNTCTTFERFKFFKCQQEPNESMDNFYLRVKKLASTCELGTIQESLVRHVMVCGLRSKSLQSVDSVVSLSRGNCCKTNI